MTIDEGLASRRLAALDGLLRALELEPAGDGRFRAVGEPRRFDHAFGGQLLAQALAAAGATMRGKDPDSLHAYFVAGGAPEVLVDLEVDTVRDGRSLSTRRVTVSQQHRPLLVAIVASHRNPPTADLADEPPAARRPEDVPLLQDWAERMPDGVSAHGRAWINRPPPLEMRIPEAPTFLGGAPGFGARSHWMRLPRDVGNDTLRHAALLAYASDYFLLDMAFRSHPHGAGVHRIEGTSLDHAIWFHRPTRFDRWHLHTQQTVTLSGERGLVRGSIHDIDGRLVVTAMQEVLVRPVTTR